MSELKNGKKILELRPPNLRHSETADFGKKSRTRGLKKKNL